VAGVIAFLVRARISASWPFEGDRAVTS
jgi:hypothetical protein